MIYNKVVSAPFSEEFVFLLDSLDSLDIPAVLAGEDRKVLKANRAAGAALGCSPEDIKGACLGDFISTAAPHAGADPWAGTHPEGHGGPTGDAAGIPGLAVPAGAGAVRTCCFESRCTRKNGETFASKITVIKRSQPACQAVIIQERKEDPGHAGLINELGGIINSSLSIGTIFRMVASEIKKIVDYDRASLLLYDEENKNLLIFALDTGMRTLMPKGVKAPIETTSAGWVAKNNRPWINCDLREEVLFPDDKKLADEGIRSTISIPLFKDRMLGVFNLDSTTPAKYSGGDLDILLPVARHISMALENALLFEEISKEKKEWKKTFDAITDMVWIEDGNQRIIRANQAVLEKTGFTASQVVGKPCRQVMEKIGIHVTARLCQQTLVNRTPSFLELAGRDSGIFHFWVYPLVDEEGRMYAMVHYLKDVTGQKRMEQHLIRSNRLASLGTLVAGIAHEINNPLGIIAGYSEALMDRAREDALLKVPEFEDFPEYLETIHKEIFRCKGILRSLLDFASPSPGSFRQLDINEIIKEVILLVNHKAKRLNHLMEFNLRRDLPKIYGEPGALRQLFMNIIINSMYFTPEKGRITITTLMEDGADGEGFASRPPVVKVVIRDTGAGIPAEIMDKIFDPFFTTKTAGEGTGLGLSICHKIVEEHGGSIDAQSSPGRGTAFTIKLPVDAEKRAPGTRKTHEAHEEGKKAVRNA